MKTITLTQAAFDTIINELRASRNAYVQELREQDIDLTSDEPEAEDYRAVDQALKEMLS